MILTIRRAWVFFLILSVILTCIWFKSGKLLGGGEEGLSMYAPSRSLERYQKPWYELGAGYLTAAYIPRITLMMSASFLSTMFPNWIVQSFMYFCLFFSGFTGLFLYLRYLRFNSLVSFIAAIFYFGNLYVMSQIWMRFLFTSMFAWSLLPLLLLFCSKFIDTGAKKYLFGGIGLTLLFSNVFGIPSYIFTLWVPFLILCLWQVITKENKKITIFRLLCVLGVWFIVHIWWLYPMLNLSDSAGVGLTELVRRNHSSLQGSSSFFPTSEILTLTQKYLFGASSPFSSFYQQSFVKILELLVLFIATIGFVKLLFIVRLRWISILGLVAWFISKGTNPPFGNVFFEIAFRSFPATMSLRNSYEKFGLVFAFVYSICFAIGIKKIANRSKVLSIALFAISIILSWPLWTGKLYIDKVHVAVPSEYEQVNKIINSYLNEDSRLLHAPAILGEGISYTWGYSGAEASEYLFDRTSWGRQSGPAKFDLLYASMSSSLKNLEITEGMLSELNIGAIVLHYDYENTFNTQYGDPHQISSYLSKASWLKEIYKGSLLGVYVLKQQPQGLIDINTSNWHPDKIAQRKWQISIQSPINAKLILKYADSQCWRAFDQVGKPIPKNTSNLFPTWEITPEVSMISLDCPVYPWEI